MTNDLLKRVKESSAHPDELMKHVSHTTLGKTLLLSVAVHLALIAVTSAGFVRLCVQYKSLHPKTVIKEQQIEAKRAKAAAPSVAPGSADAAVPGDSKKMADSAVGALPVAAKSPIEQTLEEVSNERPTGSNVSFDGTDEL